MIKRSNIIAALCAFAATAALTGAIEHASAADRRVHSSQCHYAYDDQGTNVFNGSYLASYGSGRTMYCPAPSDSELPHGSTTELNVHGYEPAGVNAYSYACVKYYNASGGSCGTSKSWGNTYSGVYGVSTSSWTSNPSGMPYVVNYLPASGQLFGFFMRN